jgi:hypothetical protein
LLEAVVSVLVDDASEELAVVSVLEEQAANRKLDARARYKNFFIGNLSGNRFCIAKRRHFF